MKLDKVGRSGSLVLSRGGARGIWDPLPLSQSHLRNPTYIKYPRYAKGICPKIFANVNITYSVPPWNSLRSIGRFIKSFCGYRKQENCSEMQVLGRRWTHSPAKGPASTHRLPNIFAGSGLSKRQVSVYEWVIVITTKTISARLLLCFSLSFIPQLAPIFFRICSHSCFTMVLTAFTTARHREGAQCRMSSPHTMPDNLPPFTGRKPPPEKHLEVHSVGC